MIIDKRGFVISKTEKDPKFFKTVKENLTVKPLVNPDYVMGPIPVYSVFQEDNNNVYLPRFFGQKQHPQVKQTFPDLDVRPHLNSVITLRDYQVPVIDAAMLALESDGGAILACGTGTGKTSMAIYLACMLRTKTLVIVHKSFLLQQWKSRIEEFVPHAKVGIIQGPVIDIENKDIVIAMLQSLAMKEYSPEIFKDFGFVIADEAHHLSAEVFCRALPKVASKYMLGLSATPKRKDGLTKVFQWYLGEIAYTLESNVCDSVLVKRVFVKCNDPKYGQEKKNFRGNILLPSMITDMTQCSFRNDIILAEAEYYCKEDRQVMIISDRIAHLEALKTKFDGRQVKAAGVDKDTQSRIITTGFYTGKQKQKELDINERKDVIFSTYGLVREGLDIQSLNTIIFATPVSDVIQACGRIMRKKHACNPLVVDIVDQYSIFYAQARKRLSFYKKVGYNIFEATYDNLDTEIDRESQLSTEDMRRTILDREESESLIVDDTVLEDLSTVRTHFGLASKTTHEKSSTFLEEESDAEDQYAN